jgi:murein DD-endopeptidase MepM/ murein hydrolase activator NlpD
MNRRTLISAALALPLSAVHAADGAPRFQYPISWPDEIPGDGFFIRHGYACENTWFSPGNLHTGEDWYAIEGETAGAEVHAIASGTVVYADSDYPGRVVIIRHEPDLFSMYGHLDYALDTAEGDRVEMGQRIGTILLRTDGAAPSHLHFEVRTFLISPEVNGDRPRYSFACGVNCPPGPGYWPINAPEHPSTMGWRNPTHVIARRMYPEGDPPRQASVIVPNGFDDTAETWTLPADRVAAERIGTMRLSAGDRFPLLDIAAGPEASSGWGARRYRLWYQITGDGPVWVQAATPSTGETGSDGRPSTVQFTLIPAD